MKKAFTIIELVVAMGLLMAMLGISSVVFRSAVQASRVAKATTEIAMKVQGITNQLDRDFTSTGTIKDGQIVIMWVAQPGSKPGTHERFDRIMFFSAGDFRTYNPPYIQGNIARISYMPAKDAAGNTAMTQNSGQRILARTQHILTALGTEAVINPFDEVGFINHNRYSEFEKSYLTIQGWLNLPVPDRAKMFSIITDVDGIDTLNFQQPSPANSNWGSMVDTSDINLLHNLFADGLGSFSVQGWYEAENRWFPEVDPDGDGNLSDSDFFTNAGQVDTANCPGIVYPNWGLVAANPPGGLGDADTQGYIDIPGQLQKANFNDIPGLGRALKFTFTLYDSMGIFKEGKTFTHIVYLD